MLETQMAASRPSSPSRPAARPVRLQLLGGFNLVVDGAPVELPNVSKRLLTFLALQTRPQRRSFVAGSLWPEKLENRANANLRAALWRLPEPGDEALVLSQGRELALSPGVEIDIRTAEEVGWGLVRRGVLPDALDTHLFSSDLLPGWYDEWLIAEQERVAALQLHFLDALATALLERSQVAEALDIALRLVAVDPLREGSQRSLINVYLADNNWHEALNQLERYSSLLQQTFGCAPSAELSDLVRGAVPFTPGHRGV